MVAKLQSGFVNRQSRTEEKRSWNYAAKHMLLIKSTGHICNKTWGCIYRVSPAHSITFNFQYEPEHLQTVFIIKNTHWLSGSTKQKSDSRWWTQEYVNNRSRISQSLTNSWAILDLLLTYFCNWALIIAFVHRRPWRSAVIDTLHVAMAIFSDLP